MDIERIWQFGLSLTLFELVCLGALLTSVVIAASFAIYMYVGLMLEELRDFRETRVRRDSWIRGHARQHGTPKPV
ncbi:MAG: hypothetical protein ACXWCY_26085 [Burkholderiales bacterium]